MVMEVRDGDDAEGDEGIEFVRLGVFGLERERETRTGEGESERGILERERRD